MEKQTKRQSPQRDDGPEIELKYPDECPICGYSPPPDLGKPDLTKVWLAIPSPAPGIWFLICPACHGLSTNTNAAENLTIFAKMQQKKEESRIVTPNRDNIVVPKLHMGRE